jgi:hypothetical protein
MTVSRVILDSPFSLLEPAWFLGAGPTYTQQLNSYVPSHTRVSVPNSRGLPGSAPPQLTSTLALRLPVTSLT